MWIWIWIERVGDLYVGEAYDEHGVQLIKISEPLTSTAMHACMVAAGAAHFNDCGDIDSALVDADDHAKDTQNVARRDYFHLQVRASAGHATAADVAWVADELKSRASIHTAASLLRTLGAVGAVEHEELIASFLEPSHPHMADTAMRTLFQLGFGSKYTDTLVDWIRSERRADWRLHVVARSYAGWYISHNPNAKLLRALIDVAKATRPQSGQVHAVECLYPVLDIESDLVVETPGGALPRSEDPAFVAAVLDQASQLLMQWEAANP